MPVTVILVNAIPTTSLGASALANMRHWPTLTVSLSIPIRTVFSIRGTVLLTLPKWVVFPKWLLCLAPNQTVWKLLCLSRPMTLILFIVRCRIFWPTLKPAPELVNATSYDTARINEVKAAVPVVEGQGYKYFGNHRSVAVIGNIPYTLSTDVFSDDELNEAAITILQEGITMYFKIGELEVAASREVLNYTPATKKKLAAVLNSVAQDFIQKGNDQFKNCKTFWDAKILYKSAFAYGGALHRFGQFLKRQVSFHGQAYR